MPYKTIAALLSVAFCLVFISENGHIITNRHVLMGDERQQEAVAADGRVVGVNTMKELTREFERLGFAIPIQAVLSEFGDEL